jgi:glutamate-1-semialdehyde 2,1-aminomutase
VTGSGPLFRRALARIPGGVNSPVRAFGAVGGDPFFVERGEGAFLYDVDGRRFLDYVQSWGASILGHAHPAVVEAVQRAAAGGTSYGAPTEGEVLLAEAICARVPSVEKVRLVSSGTEAAMTAVRLARGASGRSKILKFAGCYHGHVADTFVVPYNDEAALDAVFTEHGRELAAVLVEPVAANMGLVPPKPGFLEAVRAACVAHNTVLVFDEVITGFRLGLTGAQGWFGITPDLSIFGKVVGGGLPLAAVGGPASLMDELAPVGAVYQAGTLSGNPLATAAGLAVLDALDDSSYDELERTASRLADGLTKAFANAAVPAQVTRARTVVGVFFTPDEVTNYDDAKRADQKRYAAYFHHLLDDGVYVAPSAFETMFPSLAHTDADVDQTIEAATRAAAAIAGN